MTGHEKPTLKSDRSKKKKDRRKSLASDWNKKAAERSKERPSTRKAPSERKPPERDWLKGLPGPIEKGWATDVSKALEAAMAKLTREYEKTERQKAPAGRSAPKKRETRPARPQPREKPPAPEKATPEITAKERRPGAQFVLFNTPEFQKAVKDLEPVKIRGRPFWEAARIINRGDVPILMIEGQKIFCFDRKGEVLGDVGAYWRGSTGTNRPAVNLSPGTYVVDRGSLDVYAAPSGKIVGKANAEYGTAGSEVIARGEKGVFLDPVGRVPHRHMAFRDVVKDRQLIVIRVPRERNMMPMSEDASLKISEAFARSAKYLSPELKKTVESIARHPVEAVLMSLTGSVGLMLFGAQAVSRLGEATAIAQSAETPDAINVAARMYAGVLGDAGLMAALYALTRGAVKGVRAVAARVGGRASVKVEGRVAEKAKTDLGTADTVRRPIEYADTIRRPAGPKTSPARGAEFEFFRDAYFKGNEPKAQRLLRKVYEGDLEAGIKSQEFKRRLDGLLKNTDSISAKRARRLARDVDTWYAVRQDLARLKRGECVSVGDVRAMSGEPNSFYGRIAMTAEGGIRYENWAISGTRAGFTWARGLRQAARLARAQGQESFQVLAKDVTRDGAAMARRAFERYGQPETRLTKTTEGVQYHVAVQKVSH